MKRNYSDYHSATNQKIIGKLVDREVIHCASYMVHEMALKTDYDEEILNLLQRYPDNSDASEELGELIDKVESKVDETQERIEETESEICDLEDAEDTQAGEAAKKVLETLENVKKKLEEKQVALESEKDDLESEQEEPIEALEHWIVTNWFAAKLEEKGEIVGELFDFQIWGRTCSGQAILLDTIMGEIAEDMEILDGMKNSWAE